MDLLSKRTQIELKNFREIKRSLNSLKGLDIHLSNHIPGERQSIEFKLYAFEKRFLKARRDLISIYIHELKIHVSHLEMLDEVIESRIPQQIFDHLRRRKTKIRKKILTIKYKLFTLALKNIDLN